MSLNIAEIESPHPDSGAQSTLPSTGERLIEHVIQPPTGWQLVNVRELWEYRDLFRFLVWRSVKVRYAQSALGIGWAVIQPLFQMIVFTIIFGRLVRVDSNGLPYAVFSFAALVPWTYFSTSLTEGTASLVTNAAMVSKVYFPRLIMPLSAVVAKLVDFGIAMVVLCLLMAWYGIYPDIKILFLPVFMLVMLLTAAGLAMWLTALAIQYRDVNYAMSFMVQMLMYSVPVVYSASVIPEKYQLIYALNPMVCVIEGFRWSMLSTRGIPWQLLAVGAPMSVLLFVSGAIYFRRRERRFADVV